MKVLSADVKTIRGCLIASLFAVLAGCSSTSTAPTQTKPVAKPIATSSATPAPVAATSAVPGGPSGSVVFFRDSKFVGGGVSFKVREGEQELGKLSNGTYFVAQVPTGAHAFTVHSEAKDVLNLEVEQGETYYVQGSISMGVLVGRPNLSPSDAATFDALKPKLKDSAARKK